MMNNCVKRCAVVLALVATVAIGAPAVAATHEVTVANFAFTPSDVTVAPGDTVHWTWAGGNHSVTSGPDTCVADGRFDSGVQSSGDFSWTVPAGQASGVVPYFCIPHCVGGMTGTITVLGGIPTMSEWGVGVMALLVLTAGTVAFGLRRRRAATVRA